MAGGLIGSLRVSLSAETASFESGMKRAQRTAASTTSGISKSLAGVKASLVGFAGALSVGLFARAIAGALEYAGSLGETAQQLGVTTRELQNFRYAALQNGASVEEADRALAKGYSPQTIRPTSLIKYMPLVRDPHEIRNGLAINTQSGSVSPHGRIIGGGV